MWGTLTSLFTLGDLPSEVTCSLSVLLNWWLRA